MAENIFIEYRHTSLNVKAIEKKIEGIWTSRGHKEKEMTSLNIYYKSEEGMCYYVINEEIEGCFSIESVV